MATIPEFKKKETRAEGEEKKIQPLIFCTTIDGEVNIIQPTEMPRLRLRRSCLWCWIDRSEPTGPFTLLWKKTFLVRIPKMGG